MTKIKRNQAFLILGVIVAIVALFGGQLGLFATMADSTTEVQIGKINNHEGAFSFYVGSPSNERGVQCNTRDFLNLDLPSYDRWKQGFFDSNYFRSSHTLTVISNLKVPTAGGENDCSLIENRNLIRGVALPPGSTIFYTVKDGNNVLGESTISWEGYLDREGCEFKPIGGDNKCGLDNCASTVSIDPINFEPPNRDFTLKVEVGYISNGVRKVTETSQKRVNYLPNNQYLEPVPRISNTINIGGVDRGKAMQGISARINYVGTCTKNTEKICCKIEGSSGQTILETQYFDDVPFNHLRVCKADMQTQEGFEYSVFAGYESGGQCIFNNKETFVVPEASQIASQIYYADGGIEQPIFDIEGYTEDEYELAGQSGGILGSLNLNKELFNIGGFSITILIVLLAIGGLMIFSFIKK